MWAGFALGCGVAFAVSLSTASLVSAICASAACLLICAAIAPHHVVPAGMVSAAVVLGVLRGSSAVVVPGPGSVNGHFGVRPLVILGTVRSADPGSGSTAIIDATHLSDADTDGRVSGGILVSGPLIPALSPGDDVEIDASGLRPLDRRPGANSAQTLEREDVQAIATSPQVFVLAAGGPSPARAIAWAQAQLLTAVNGAIPEPGAALILGIAFGIHEPLPAGVRAPLQDAGLIHIVVVSGLKVVLVIGLVSCRGSSIRVVEAQNAAGGVAGGGRIRAHQRGWAGRDPERSHGGRRDARIVGRTTDRSDTDARSCRGTHART